MILRSLNDLQALNIVRVYSFVILEYTSIYKSNEHVISPKLLYFFNDYELEKTEQILIKNYEFRGNEAIC